MILINYLQDPIVPSYGQVGSVCSFIFGFFTCKTAFGKKGGQGYSSLIEERVKKKNSIYKCIRWSGKSFNCVETLDHTQEQMLAFRMRNPAARVQSVVGNLQKLV
jgi:hypothetical protein